MKERALKWSLWLLGFFLAIGPLLVALGTHNWDITAAVLPSEAEMSGLTERLQGLTGGLFQNIEIVDNRIVGNTLEITLRFTSPIGFNLEINEFSAKLTCALDSPPVYLADVNLKNPVEIESYSTGEFTLSMNVTQTIAHYSAFHIGQTPVFNIENISFKIYGINIETTMGWQNLSIPLW